MPKTQCRAIAQTASILFLAALILCAAAVCAGESEADRSAKQLQAKGAVVWQTVSHQFQGGWLTYNNVNFYKKPDKEAKYGWDHVKPLVSRSESFVLPVDATVAVIGERTSVINTPPGMVIKTTDPSGNSKRRRWEPVSADWPTANFSPGAGAGRGRGTIRVRASGRGRAGGG